MTRHASDSEGSEQIGRCEGCGIAIFEGDPFHNGEGADLCPECAPSYQDLLDSQQYFIGPDGEPMTKAEAERIVAAHIQSGGSASDKMVFP